MNDLQTFLPQLGMAGIFLYMLYVLWNHLQKKEDYHQELTEKLLQSYQNNTQVVEEFKNNLHNSNKLLDNLSNNLVEHIYEVLKYKSDEHRKS